MTTNNVIIDARTYNTLKEKSSAFVIHSTLWSALLLLFAFFFAFFFKEKARGDIRETISDLMNRLGLDILN